MNYSCNALQIMQLNQTIDYKSKIAVLKRKQFTMVGLIKDDLFSSQLEVKHVRNTELEVIDWHLEFKDWPLWPSRGLRSMGEWCPIKTRYRITSLTFSVTISLLTIFSTLLKKHHNFTKHLSCKQLTLKGIFWCSYKLRILTFFSIPQNKK